MLVAGLGSRCSPIPVLAAGRVTPATITGGLLRAPSAGGSGVVPAWAGFCDYVPAGVSVKTPHGSGVVQTNVSGAELERSQHQLRRDGLCMSPCGLHTARLALRTHRFQNHPLRLHPTGDSEYAELCCVTALH